MDRSHLLRALALAALVVSATPAAACMSDKSDDAAAEGRLSISNAQDAAGRPQRPYILILAAPACLSSDDPDGRVDQSPTIHVFSSDEAIHVRLSKLVGRAIRVRGRPFAAHTAHHHAPIVMDIATITVP